MEDLYPFVWQRGETRFLARPGDLLAGINNRGVVTGWAYSDGWTRYQAFVGVPGRPRRPLPSLLLDDGTPGNARPYAINEVGEVVGESFSGASRRHAVRWGVQGVRGLGLLDGDDESVALDINQDGRIVGFSMCCNGSYLRLRAVIHDRELGMVDLATLVDPDDPLKPHVDAYLHASAINDQGQVAGTTRIDGHSVHIRLDPVR